MNIDISLHGVLRIGRFEEAVREYPPGTRVQDVVEDLGLPEHLLGIVVINDRHAGVDSMLEDGDRLMLLPLLDGG